MYPLFAPTASAAIITPSITECGSCSKIRRSLQVPGSLSSPLHSTYFGFADCLGTNDHFMPVGKSGAAAAAQFEVLDLVDDGVRLHGERLLHGLVAVEFEIAVEVGRTHAKALGDDLYFVGMGNQISHEIE